MLGSFHSVRKSKIFLGDNDSGKNESEEPRTIKDIDPFFYFNLPGD